MKISLTETQFIDHVSRYSDNRFRQMGGYAGWSALFAYLEDLEESIGEEIEADVIGLCCDFSRASSAREHCEQYDYEGDPESEDPEADALEWLRDRTTVIEYDGGIIIQQF